MAAAVATKRKTFSLETAYRDSLQIQLIDGSSCSSKKEKILRRQLTAGSFVAAKRKKYLQTAYRWEQQ